MRSLPRLMLSYSRYHHRADGLATVKATRCAGGPRPTLTAAARRAFAERVGSEGNVAVVPPRERSFWTERALPLLVGHRQAAEAVQLGGPRLTRVRGRIEPAVSGGFGSQFSRRTSEKRRHVAPAHPAGWGAASITSHLRCARHT